MKLEILIPTYERPRSLGNLLLEIEKQIQSLAVFDDVSIQVFNNTLNKEILKLYDKIFSSLNPRLQFIATKNRENLGMVGNWNECLLQKATDSDYIWLLNDDDLPQSNALELILLGMRLNPLKSLVFWSREVSSNGIEVTPKWTWLRKFFFARCKNPELKSVDFLMDYPFQSFSSFVLRREHVNGRQFLAEYYPSFDYQFAATLLPAINHVVIPEYLMKIIMGQNESLNTGVREEMPKVRRSIRSSVFENDNVGFVMRLIIRVADRTDASKSFLLILLRNIIKLALLLTTRRN